TPETIRKIRQIEGFCHPHYLILDRWALNSPDMLKAWEDRGEIFLLTRLDEQQTREHYALCSDEGWEMSRRGMSDWEILESLGIDTELRTIE
ncbi:MAG: hypothetical protein LBB66_05875, partial [Desulfovibrio sp.]|nr:hypothetical protein [Desulfovibrio sp.]